MPDRCIQYSVTLAGRYSIKNAFLSTDISYRVLQNTGKTSAPMRLPPAAAGIHLRAIGEDLVVVTEFVTHIEGTQQTAQ